MTSKGDMQCLLQSHLSSDMMTKENWQEIYTEGKQYCVYFTFTDLDRATLFHDDDDDDDGDAMMIIIIIIRLSYYHVCFISVRSWKAVIFVEVVQTVWGFTI
jgi:hypothetical protein